MDLYFNRQGKPISMEQWSAEFARDRVVRHTALGPLGTVSTVFLGLNHGWGEGPPMIFETMVFGGPMDEYMDRYATEEQAITGHEFLVLALLIHADPTRPRRQLIHNGRKPR